MTETFRLRIYNELPRDVSPIGSMGLVYLHEWLMFIIYIYIPLDPNSLKFMKVPLKNMGEITPNN